MAVLLAYVAVGCDGEPQLREPLAPATARHSEALVVVPQGKLVASDAAIGDAFGYSVSISADTALVGAMAKNATGLQNVGSAYVFRWSDASWVEEAKLSSFMGQYSYFGHAVALHGDTAAITAPGSPTKAGSARIYLRSGTVWSIEDELVPSESALDDGFGHSIALDQGTVVVGAPSASSAGVESGLAFVFVRAQGNWTEQAKLVPSAAVASSEFGYAVAVSGDTLIVGARRQPPSQTGVAVVYVRSAGTWTEQQKLVPLDAAAADEVGYSVALAGETALVGAYGADPGGTQNAGAACVFSRSGTTWTEQAKLAANGPVADARFGTSVALSNTLALVGASLDGGGSAYVFERAGAAWTQKAHLSPSGTAAFDLFGVSVALSGQSAIVGAHGHDLPTLNSGAAYAFAVQRETGEACLGGAECLSGHCVDSVCCESACGGGATDDCSACSVAQGSSADGLCTPTTSTSCDDGNPCTEADACQAGVCAGAPFVCTPLDSCHEAGTCDPVTGVCSTPARPDGASCNDSDACTLAETCQAGVCVPHSEVQCPEPGECDELGQCNPFDGTCTSGSKPDGTPCSLGTCSGGLCVSGVGGAAGGSSGGVIPPNADDGGCGCRLPATMHAAPGAWTLLVLAVWWVRRRHATPR